jgi:hypothetical protein
MKKFLCEKLTIPRWLLWTMVFAANILGLLWGT